MKKRLIRKTFFLSLLFLIFFYSEIILVSAVGKGFDDAQNITVGTYTGSLVRPNVSSGRVTEYYFYKIYVPAGKRLDISVRYKKPEGNVNDNARLAIYNSMQDRVFFSEKLFSRESYESGFSSVLTGYRYTSNEVYGEYYIAVGVEFLFEGSRVEYVLNVSIKDLNEAGSGGDIPETFENAYEVTAGNYSNCCSISSDGYLRSKYGEDSKDVFKIKLNKKEKLTLKVVPDSDSKLKVKIFDESRRELKSSYSLNPGETISLDYVSPNDQFVYFSVAIDSTKLSYYGFIIKKEKVSSLSEDDKSSLSTSYDGSDIIRASSTKKSLKTTSKSSSVIPSFGSLKRYSSIFGAIMVFGPIFLVVLIVITISLYVYLGLTYSTIARKNNQSAPALAWIPFVGPTIIAYRASQTHWWWAWLFLGISIVLFFFIFSLLFLIFFVLLLFAFCICVVIWNWKMFEAVGRPGWWAIIPFIPFVGFIIYLVFIGIAAWGKSPDKK